MKSVGKAAGEGTSVLSPGEVLDLRVARLGLRMDARKSGLSLAAPPGHLKFLQPQATGMEGNASPGTLVLCIRNESLPMPKTWGVPLCCTEIWEMWLDETGSYVFVAPRQTPPSRIEVDPGFTTGEMFGDFQSSAGTDLYPLQGLDNILLVNWLASLGDLMLHACGVVVDGKGYAFVGSAGAGKSTLASSLARDHAFLVLGEDQVILRFLEGRFWIYGTPWHENPAMCSPWGAPLEKLFFLDRNARPGVSRLTHMHGITGLLQTAFVPYYRPKLVSDILDRLALLAEQVPFHSLSYQLGTDARKLIFTA
jgi:hypothetical protein